jgi:hypothetical protein
LLGFLRRLAHRVVDTPVHRLHQQQVRGHRARRAGRCCVRGGAALALLALAGCGELHFVPSPYTPQDVELVYSEQEDVTIVRWRVDGKPPLADTRFEMLRDGGYQPIDFSQSVFTGGVNACRNKKGSCVQFVMRGKHELPNGTRPIQAVHDVYGVLPGLVATKRTVSETVKIDSYFRPRNDLVYVNFLLDAVASDGPYDFPRPFERAMWPTGGLCVSDTAPDDVSFLPLEGGFEPERPLTDEGIYCVGARPLPADGGAAALLQVRIATQPEMVKGMQMYVPPVERSPVIYQIILDLEIPVPDRCAQVIQEIEQMIGTYMTGSQVPVPVHKLPTVNLAADGSSQCAQTNGRIVRATEMAKGVMDLVSTLPGVHHQVHMLYFNNLDAPLPTQLVNSFDLLFDAMAKGPPGYDLQTYSWIFNPGGGAVPTTQRPWWAFWIWQTTDESFEMKLDSYQNENLPRTTQEHDSSKPVLLLSPDQTAAHEGDQIKICYSVPLATPFAQQPVPHPIFAPSWEISTADPPAYLIALHSQIVMRVIDFTEVSALVKYEICTRYCEKHGYVAENKMGVDSWVDSPLCTGSDY